MNWDSITCLIVDDDKFSRTFIKTALHQIGIKSVKEAEDFDEAVGMLNLPHIDIILLDQQMPEKTGLDFAKELRNKDNTKDIPIIMITIDTKEKTVMDARKLGIQEYLIKPISPLALKKRIANVLKISDKDSL